MAAHANGNKLWQVLLSMFIQPFSIKVGNSRLSRSYLVPVSSAPAGPAERDLPSSADLLRLRLIRLLNRFWVLAVGHSRSFWVLALRKSNRVPILFLAVLVTFFSLA